MLFMGKDFEKGNQFDGGSILDIAPTIATLMGVFIPREWEGKSLI
jgi:bisphosphoglycerate-independent phosphoglycerate mutase (AlkP superfamily)